ncbi:MAG: pentapeptide repeat-containing protein, partial [Cyanobacteria bacterium J06597_16]
DLSHADLSGADLIGADLSGADLSGADLSGAKVGYGDKIMVKLLGARLTGTIMPNGRIHE